MPCLARCFASSTPECRVSIFFSFATVRMKTRLAFSRIGIASAIARVVVARDQILEITVLSAKGAARLRVCGRTMVGRPEPKMIDSAYH